MAISIYELNRHVREQKLKAAMVELVDPKHAPGLEIENLPAKNGSNTFRIRRQGSGCLFAHSAFNPEQEAERLIAHLDFARPTLVFVFGLGLGYHVEKILARASRKSRVVVIEPDQEIYDNAMKQRDMRPILGDRRVMLFVGIDPDKTLAVLGSMMGKFIMDLSFNIQYMALNYYHQFHRNESFILQEIMNLAIFTWRCLGNCHVDHNIGVLQSMFNLETVLQNPGLADVVNVYLGKPAIIVSAGPSLDKNMHCLKDAKGKALIVAVDAVMTKLLKAGIVPDLVVSIERIGPYENIFANLEAPPKSIVFAAPALTQVETLKFFRDNRKIFWFQQGVGTQEYFDQVLRKGTLANGSAAAYAALSLVEKLGFARVALVGQDLAYGAGGQVYSEGISQAGSDIEEERKQALKGYTVTVKDYEGRDIASNVLWKDQLLSFTYFIKSHGIKVFDATEGGARIDGAENIPLRDYIYRYCAEPLNSIVDHLDAWYLQAGSRNTETTKRQLLDELNKDCHLFSEIKEDLSQKERELQALSTRYIENRNPLPADVSGLTGSVQHTTTIIDKITKNNFLTLYYQGLIAAFKKEINEMSESEFNSRLLKHIKVQSEFIKLMNDVYKLNFDFFLFITGWLEQKLEGAAVEDDVREVLKKVMNDNGIDPELVNQYYTMD